MFSRVRVIGRGRVGAALAARLVNQGIEVAEAEADLVVLCVPDRHVAEVAASVPAGPWIAHVSGAQPLAALDPHTQRFTLHPLQTFDTSGAPAQFDGAWAGLAAESAEGMHAAEALAALLGLRPFVLRDGARASYHAGAAMASNYLVTLYRAASRLVSAAGVPPAALVPLMQRTIDNGFQLTGPIARGDWATVEAHREAIRRDAPELSAMYDELARVTAP